MNVTVLRETEGNIDYIQDNDTYIHTYNKMINVYILCTYIHSYLHTEMYSRLIYTAKINEYHQTVNQFKIPYIHTYFVRSI